MKFSALKEIDTATFLLIMKFSSENDRV